MTYIPDAYNSAEPVGGREAGNAAAELRAIKSALLGLLERVETLEAGGGGGGSGDVTGASNLASAGLFLDKSGATLRFKGIGNGTGVGITTSSTQVTLQTVIISATDPGPCWPGAIWIQP